MTIYNITPVSKPRMTKRDKWSKRPATDKYWQFKDEIRSAGITIEDGAHIQFFMPMPKSWSAKKKKEMAFTYHKQKPDCDNLLKAIMDAVFDDDAHISCVTVSKMWAYHGYISIT